MSSLSYNERTFLAPGCDGQPCVFDHASLTPETIDPDVADYFGGLDHERGDVLVACGWAMAESLEKLL
jgi:hypothetical protein